MKDETGLNTLEGAFIKVLKIITDEDSVADCWTFIKLSEIKVISEDNRFSNVLGCMIKTYKNVSYYCFLSANELIKLINLFIFKPDEYYEAYGC